MLFDIDSETLGKVADTVTKFIGFVGVCWHFYRRRVTTENKKRKAALDAAEQRKKLAAQEALGSKPVASEADYDARFVVGAVFSNLELSNKLDTLQKDLEIMTRDRDQHANMVKHWRDIANEREDQLKEERKACDRLRRENTRLLTEDLVRSASRIGLAPEPAETGGDSKVPGITAQEQE